MKRVWIIKISALRTLKEYSKLFFPYCFSGNMQVIWVTSEESIDKYKIVFWKVIARTCRDFLLEEHCKKLFDLMGIFFLIGIHSMQGLTASTRHGVTGKRNSKRLRHTGNLFRKNLQSKDVWQIIDLKPFRS